VPIPQDPARCTRLRARLRNFREQPEAEFTSQAAQKTANEKIHAKVVALLKHKLAAI